MFKVKDTHNHFDAEEFDEDRAEAFARAREAGVGKVFLPAMANCVCSSWITK